MIITDETKHTASDVIASAFILMFIYAAFSKLSDFEKFQIQLGKSPLISHFVPLVALSVPLIELITAATLMMKRYQLIGFYTAYTLMTLFTGYIIYILNFSAFIPCSCGGILENMSWSQHLIFNVVFTALAVAAVLIHPIKKSLLQ